MTEPDAPDVMAAELALGLLDGDERAVALRRQLAEPDFAREVERWHAHFAHLFAAIPGIAPSPDLERRIAARIDGRGGSSPSGWWRPVAIASSLAAASLLGVLLIRPEAVTPPPVTIAAPAPLIAAFSLPGREAPVAAVYDPRLGQVKMAGSIDVPAGRDAQLWAIVGKDPPKPLGVFRVSGGAIAADARTDAIAPGTTLAISIEPVGGSPTGLPTGPVIATATVARI